MAADNKSFINPLGHIEGLVSVKDRIVRKKKKQPENEQNDQQDADDQLAEELDEHYVGKEVEDGHVDFKA